MKDRVVEFRAFLRGLISWEREERDDRNSRWLSHGERERERERKRERHHG